MVRRNKRDEDMFIDEGKIKYGGERERKTFDEMFEVEREERSREIQESRFKRRFKI